MMYKKIFISYARTDGETFATDLRQRLERDYPELTLWQDRAQMEGGIGWWQQIEEALQYVEFMVLVATPAAMTSPIVKKEWRYARQQGVCIYPVQVPEHPIDFASLPHWMRDVHFYDLDHEWETFIGYLHSPCRQTRVPFMAPDMGVRFVERPHEFDQLLDHLLDTDRENPVAITTALRGAGGFGKTTLAAALCHHDDINTAFDDGILWVSLGEKPNITDKLGEMLIAFTGQQPIQKTEDGLATELSEKLADKDCLMVIDDVWNSAHLRPFLRGGERCGRLITTRNVKIAVDANAQHIDVDEMTSSESVAMLVGGIESLLDDLTQFAELAHRLGEWPLMLELANGFLRECLEMGDSLVSALVFLNQALDDEGIEAINTEDEDERKRGALSTLTASLRILSEQEQRYLIELSIFPEDTDILLGSIGQLWGTGGVQTRRLCQRLARLSFFKFMPQAGTIRFHDVIRESLHTQLSDAPQLHQRLLTAWGDDVYALPPDDTYAWRWVIYHLHGADHDNDLKALFADQRWMHTRFEHDNYTYTGYLRDVMFVWNWVAQPKALAQIESHDDPVALVDCLRYALISTSINSLAENYIPKVVARAVETGIWTADRALSMARQVPYPDNRTYMYIQLLTTGRLNADQALEAENQVLETMLDIWDIGSRSIALARFADWLEGETRQQVVQQALEMALAIGDDEERWMALAGLANQLEGEQVQQGLEGTLAIRDGWYRSSALAGLANRLEGEQIQQALDAALAIGNVWDRSRALMALANRLEGEQVQQALDAILDEGPRLIVLAGLVDLPEARQQIIQQALEATLQTKHEGMRADALAALANRLEGDQVQQALEAALDIDDEAFRARALAGLADRLDERQVQQVLEAALAIGDERDWSKALAILADQLEGKQILQVLEAALAIEYEEYRWQALARLIGRLEGDQVQQALDAALARGDEKYWSRALVALANRLKGGQIQQA